MFPLVAVREALVNAICHRDYSNMGGSVSLAIYDNRMEIISEGKLPVGITLADLKRKHGSQPRNQIIANTFYLMGFVEQWGRGTETIIDACVSAGRQEPEFVEMGNTFCVRFFPETNTVAKELPLNSLTKKQQEIINILRDKGRVSTTQLASYLKHSLPDRTLRYELNKLHSAGVIETEGHTNKKVWWYKQRDAV